MHLKAVLVKLLFQRLKSAFEFLLKSHFHTILWSVWFAFALQTNCARVHLEPDRHPPFQAVSLWLFGPHSILAGLKWTESNRSGKDTFHSCPASVEVLLLYPSSADHERLQRASDHRQGRLRRGVRLQEGRHGEDVRKATHKMNKTQTCCDCRCVICALCCLNVRYAMKCLDKKRIKMKQGETLALNERIMLSLVSTGVSYTHQQLLISINSDSL